MIDCLSWNVKAATESISARERMALKGVIKFLPLLIILTRSSIGNWLTERSFAPLRPNLPSAPWQILQFLSKMLAPVLFEAADESSNVSVEERFTSVWPQESGKKKISWQRREVNVQNNLIASWIGQQCDVETWTKKTKRCKFFHTIAVGRHIICNKSHLCKRWQKSNK